MLTLTVHKPNQLPCSSQTPCHTALYECQCCSTRLNFHSDVVVLFTFTRLFLSCNRLYLVSRCSNMPMLFRNWSMFPYFCSCCRLRSTHNKCLHHTVMMREHGESYVSIRTLRHNCFVDFHCLLHRESFPACQRTFAIAKKPTRNLKAIQVLADLSVSQGKPFVCYV